MKGKTVSLIVIGILISFLIVGCGTKKGSEGNLKAFNDSLIPPLSFWLSL